MTKASAGVARTRQFGTLLGLVSLSVVLWILTPHFLTVSNLLNVLEQSAINAIVAAGMTFVIISGGIDLSVGSVLALCRDRAREPAASGRRAADRLDRCAGERGDLRSR